MDARGGSGLRAGCRRRLLVVAALAIGTVLFMAAPASACSVCFGADDPDAVGLSWGVAILLAPVLLVQAALARFVLRAVRRQRRGVPGASQTGGERPPEVRP